MTLPFRIWHSSPLAARLKIASIPSHPPHPLLAWGGGSQAGRHFVMSGGRRDDDPNPPEISRPLRKGRRAPGVNSAADRQAIRKRGWTRLGAGVRVAQGGALMDPKLAESIPHADFKIQ